MRIGYKISWLVVGAVLLATAILTLLGYTSARRQYLAGVDEQLTTAAAALPGVIGQDYLARALTGRDLPANEYDRLVKSLSDLADRSRLVYVYAFALDGDKVVHLATSASAAERTAGDWATFRQPYEEPPPSLLATFADGQTRFAEYTDEFGSFRSIFIRHTAPAPSPPADPASSPPPSGAAGMHYVIGVDASLSEIRGHLARLIARSLAAGGLVALLAGTVGTLIARRIAHPLRELSQEVDAWSRRDFARDDSIRAHLEQLARRHRDETGDLARRFVDVQDRLQTYLKDLTETTAAKQKIEQQLEIAKTIQEGLLPGNMPEIQNFHVVGWSQPADQTGGDYFDWQELPNGKLMLTIGDVTGHGIGPALVTAASRAYARATLNADDALDATIARLNDLLHGDLKGERFVTLVAGLLDPVAREMKLVAAGHGPVLFYSRRRDQVDATTDSQGIPLGIMGNMPYDRPLEMHFEPGDVLVLVSDGFFEWMNAADETFGVERLIESVLASCRTAPDEIIDRLRRDISAFHGGTAQADDTTALIVRCVS